jgi:hypothetical protein
VEICKDDMIVFQDDDATSIPLARAKGSEETNHVRLFWHEEYLEMVSR